MGLMRPFADGDGLMVDLCGQSGVDCFRTGFANLAGIGLFCVFLDCRSIRDGLLILFLECARMCYVYFFYLKIRFITRNVHSFIQ